MSRGLGKVQRVILDALSQEPHGLEMNVLAARVFHAATYPGEDTGEDKNYSRRWLLWAAQVRRAEYVSTFRAVQALERLGHVQTEIKHPKPIMGYLPPNSARWKLVKLSVDKQQPLSTLKTSS